MGEVVPARTSPTLHLPFPPTVQQLSQTSTVRVKCLIVIIKHREGIIVYNLQNSLLLIRELSEETLN